MKNNLGCNKNVLLKKKNSSCFLSILLGKGRSSGIMTLIRLITQLIGGN